VDRVVLTVESDADVGGCPGCGVVAVGHGRRRRAVADAPCIGIPVRLVWLARLWRCREPACLVKVFTEQLELVPPRAKVTSRAAAWATDALTFDDTTVSALARHLGVDWHTCWDAVEAEATLQGWPTRPALKASKSLGSTSTSGGHPGSETPCVRSPGWST
jgi:transposase